MVRLYLDDCLIAKDMARQLRAAGHLIYLTSELGVEGQHDEGHLDKAAQLGAVLTTQNQKDFAPLHARWREQGRDHAGILLVRQMEYIGEKIERLARAARLLTPEAAHNQLMYLAQFRTEEEGRSYILGLTLGAR